MLLAAALELGFRRTADALEATRADVDSFRLEAMVVFVRIFTLLLLPCRSWALGSKEQTKNLALGLADGRLERV